MQIYFVIALVFAVLVAVFAIQNSTPVEIHFLIWEIKRISQVLVILGASAVGALTVLFLGLGKQIRLVWQVRQLGQQNIQLKEECKQLKEQLNAGSEQLSEEKQDRDNTNAAETGDSS